MNIGGDIMNSQNKAVEKVNKRKMKASYAWEFYKIMGYRAADDDEAEGLFENWIKNLVKEAEKQGYKKYKFTDEYFETINKARQEGYEQAVKDNKDGEDLAYENGKKEGAEQREKELINGKYIKDCPWARKSCDEIWRAEKRGAEQKVNEIFDDIDAELNQIDNKNAIIRLKQKHLKGDINEIQNI